MAVYAHTVTSKQRKANKIAENLYIFVGQLNITNYNSTTVDITGIRGKFKELLSIAFDISDSGQMFQMDIATGKVKAFASGGTAGVPLVEDANDTDVGEANFVAIGFG